jgi:hypothetical protein
MALIAEPTRIGKGRLLGLLALPDRAALDVPVQLIARGARGRR